MICTTIYKTQCDKCKRGFEMDEMIRFSVGNTNGYVCKTCAEALRCFVKEDYILPNAKDDHKQAFDKARVLKFLESERQKAALRASLAVYTQPKLYKMYSKYEEAIEKFLTTMENMEKEDKNGS